MHNKKTLDKQEKKSYNKYKRRDKGVHSMEYYVRVYRKGAGYKTYNATAKKTVKTNTEKKVEKVEKKA